MTDLQLAKENLNGHSIALCKNGEVITSDKRGVAPLLDMLREGVCLQGFSAADKIVGKAAAMLFVKAGVVSVYAQVLSKSGKEFLEKHGISVSFETLTDVIINRDGTGMCPMESTVLNVDDVETGISAIGEKLDRLRINGSVKNAQTVKKAEKNKK